MATLRRVSRVSKNGSGTGARLSIDLPLSRWNSVVWVQ